MPGFSSPETGPQTGLLSRTAGGDDDLFKISLCIKLLKQLQPFVRAQVAPPLLRPEKLADTGITAIQTIGNPAIGIAHRRQEPRHAFTLLGPFEPVFGIPCRHREMIQRCEPGRIQTPLQTMAPGQLLTTP